MKTSIALTLRLDEEIYNGIKEMAKAHQTSFTAFVQGILAGELKNQEKKALYDAFSLVGQDVGEADVEYAVTAQREAFDQHE
jgi:hypothetical protein